MTIEISCKEWWLSEFLMSRSFETGKETFSELDTYIAL